MRWAVLVFLMGAAPAFACSVTFVDAGPPPALGPDRSVSTPAPRTGDVHLAYYSGADRSYGHGILGRLDDARGIAFDVFHAEATPECGEAPTFHDAGPGHVFEDVAPRLADVDGDTRPEIVAVRSSLSQGAQLIIYALRGNGLEVIAATPYIGRRHRWLAPAAIGDLDGDGHVEIAYVDRPHLAKTLRIWRYADGNFREVASAGGLTNHAIGDEVIHGGLRDCGQGPEIVLSDAGRDRMLAVTYDGAAITARDIGRFTAEGAARAVGCR